MPGNVASPVSPIQESTLPPVPQYGQDTRTWGVRYNHAPQRYGIEDEQPPALPPRPTTTPSQPAYQRDWQHQQQLAPSDYIHSIGTVPLPPPPLTSPPPHSYALGPDVTAIDYAHNHNAYNSLQTHNANQGAWITPSQQAGQAGQPGKPPTPPPRPAQYQNQWHPHLPQTTAGYSGNQQYHSSGLLDHHQGEIEGGSGISHTNSPPPIADYNLNAAVSLPVQSLEEPMTDQQVLGTNPLGHSESAPSPQLVTDNNGTLLHDVPSAANDALLSPAASHMQGELVAHDPSEDSSAEPEPKFAGIQRTGTIDSVIQAWTKPIQPDQLVTQSTPWDDPGFAPALRQLSLLTKSIDPFQDLSPEARASLERFAVMLRKENDAETDDEKFQIFDAFVQKESRLRTVLYGRDISPTDQLISNSPLKPKTSRVSDSFSKIEPPGDTEGSGKQHASQDFGRLPSITSPEESSRSPEKTSKEEEVARNSRPSSRALLDRSGLDKEVSLQRHGSQMAARDIASIQDTSSSPETRSTKLSSSPSANAPIVIEPDDVSVLPPYRQATGDTVTSISTLAQPAKSDRSYTPFKYRPVNDPRLRQEAGKRSSTESYAALRQASSTSGRAMGPSIVPPSLSMNQSYPRIVPKEEQAEAFLGLLREQSRSEGGRTPSPSASIMTISLPQQPSDALEKLKALIPAELPQYLESKSLSTIKRSLQSIPDDFSFIKTRVLEWSRTNLEEKKRLDIRRGRRNEEFEKHIDALFNENEIGYSEIAPLEEEHRAEEARILAKEEMEEVDNFKVQVFTNVTGRLQSDLNSLAQIYADAMTLVESQSASGSEFIKDSPTKTALPQAMDLLLVVFSKMQIRHQKLLEAALEHSRRARKAKVGSLRAAGEVMQAQEYEMSSLKAEQDMIIDTKEKDDDRANFLLDTFDMVTVNGLSQNQSYVDELLTPLREVEELVSKGSGYDLPSLISLLLSAQSVLDFVAADSVSIVKFSSTSDTILNNADYDVCVAKAYRSDASVEEFRLLEEEKRKEDKKIHDETAAKQESMVKGSREVQALVQSLLDQTEEGKEHKQRIEKALERAKQRNASLSGA